MEDELSAIERYLSMPLEARGIEFKEAKNQFDRGKLLDYCTAIANCGGGAMVFGITDSYPRQVCGSNALRDSHTLELQIHEKLALDVRINEHAHPDGRVVEVIIPRRLPGVPIHHEGRYLTRKGSSLVAMEPTELLAILSERQPSALSTPVLANVPETELGDYLDMTKFFALSESPVPSESRCAAVYVASGFLIERPDGNYSITGMGAILFAHNLRKFPDLVHRRLRFIKYRGRNRVHTTLDREYFGGYAIEFESYLSDIDREIPIIEGIDKGLRSNTPLYLPVTIREIVANAMSHQDFSAPPGQIRVELYEDRLEVTNPGTPMVDVKEFVRVSNPRNVDLTSRMREMNMCENRGSGIQRLLLANEVHRRSDPEFLVVSNMTRARITGKQDFTSLSIDERIWAIFMHASFRFETGGNCMTNATFRERYGLSKSKTTLVTNAIAAAIEASMIKQFDESSQSRRYAKYVPFWA